MRLDGTPRHVHPGIGRRPLLPVESLDTITQITGRSTDAARQIELATNQQRSASTQVATAVREVAGASEEVAKGAKRVTSLSNELAALAHDLQKVIVTFESAEPLTAVSRAESPLLIDEMVES